MQATEKLFDRDAYAAEFTAEILAAEYTVQKKKGLWEVILDRTLFFPEEGGQTPDTGELGGYPVVDVQLEGSVIRHFVQAPENIRHFAQIPEDIRHFAQIHEKTAEIAEDREGNGEEGSRLPFVPGQTVRGRIDFAHRFSNMQNHSGEHILSGLVHGRFGYDNVGFHLSDNTVTLDFNGPLADEDILWLEAAANRVVWDDREIRGWYPAPEELEKAVYRSKKEIDGPVRLVEIPGVDLCACCAPHVRRTGEIGLIKIIRTLRERGGIRLTILCGGRALACMQALQKAAEDVSHLTNMPREEIAAGVSRILEENEKLRQRASGLEAQAADALARAVPPDQEHVFLFADGIGNLAQRRLVNALCGAHPGYCAVFIGSDGEGYRYIIGASPETGGLSEKNKGAAAGEGSGKAAAPAADAEANAGKTKAPETGGAVKKDARVLNACLHKACGARGGGKPAMVQGSVHASETEIRAALKKALYSLEE